MAGRRDSDRRRPRIQYEDPPVNWGFLDGEEPQDPNEPPQEPPSGAGDYDPYDYYPQGPADDTGGIPPELAGWPEGISTPRPASRTPAQVARQDANGKLAAYQRALAALQERPYDPGRKVLADTAWREWSRADTAAAALEKEEAKTTTGSQRKLIGGASGPWLLFQEPDGRITQEPNPNYRPPQPAGSASSPAAMGNLDVARKRLQYDLDKAAREQDWEQYKYLQNRKWSLEDAAAKAEAARLANDQEAKQQEAQNRRLLQQYAWKAAQERLARQAELQQGVLGIGAQIARGLPPEGQTHWSGWEPGGPVSQIYGMGNSKYNPDLYKSPTPAYNAWWAQMNDWLRQMWGAWPAPPTDDSGSGEAS